VTPIANASLKAECAAYCAQERARHFTPISYEMWLEGTVNTLQLDLANARKAIHAPDAYHTALEQVDKLLEDGSPKEPSETLYVAQSNLYVLRLHVAEARQIILEALGGVDNTPAARGDGSDDVHD